MPHLDEYDKDRPLIEIDIPLCNFIWNLNVKIKDKIEFCTACLFKNTPHLYLMLFFLNSWTEYGFTKDSISTTDKAITTWHRIIEAMKFAFAKRSSLGDLNVQSHEFNRTLYEVGSLEVNIWQLYIYVFSGKTDKMLLKVHNFRIW